MEILTSTRILNYSTMTKNLQDLRAEARADFLATFKCIDSSCDQNGCVPHQSSDGGCEPQQCQYCWEIRFPAADKLNTLIDSVLDRAEACAPTERRIEMYHGPLPHVIGLEFKECREEFLTNLSTLRS